MRTTLTLDPDVVALLREKAHRERLPFKEVVNDAIRRGLTPRARRESGKPYRVVPHKAKLVAGIDRGRLNQLLDELDEDGARAS